MHNLARVAVIVTVVAICLMEFGLSDDQCQWDVHLQVKPGNSGYWTSPEALDPGYLPYYMRADLHLTTEIFPIIWVPLDESDQTLFDEAEGPIPPDGSILYPRHIEVEYEGVTVM